MSNINSTAKKGQRASVVFCEGVQVDGYQMPDGEFRVGLVGASLALGYSKEWLGRLIANSYNLPKALKGKSFEGSTKDSCNLPETGQTAKTISVKDFLVLIRFADKQGKAKAGALAEALMGLSINDYFRDAFQEQPLTIDQKRQDFLEAYSASLNWFEADREDWDAIEDAEQFLLEEKS